MLQVPGDQDIADLLSALDEASTAAPGGLYAAALPAGGAASSSSSDAAGADASLAGLDASGAAVAAAAGEQPAAGGKVAAVCAAVRQALEHRDKVRCICGCTLAPLAIVVTMHSSRWDRWIECNRS